MPTHISGFTATLAHERIEVEDTAVACLRFANGALGVIQATTSIHPGAAENHRGPRRQGQCRHRAGRRVALGLPAGNRGGSGDSSAFRAQGRRFRRRQQSGGDLARIPSPGSWPISSKRCRTGRAGGRRPRRTQGRRDYPGDLSIGRDRANRGVDEQRFVKATLK